MFSGIVRELGKVAVLDRTGTIMTLGITSTLDRELLEIGGSIAVDGVCLTLVGVDETCLFFDVIPETCLCTTIGKYQLGQPVNIESSLRLGDEVGGHFVSGHVLDIGTITGIEGNRYAFSCPPSLSPYLFEKGFLAIDGISLTLTSVSQEGFSVGVIPETLSRTTLGVKKVGDYVNLEPDMTTKVQVDTLLRLHKIEKKDGLLTVG